MNALKTMAAFNSACEDGDIGWRMTPEFDGNDKYAGLTLRNADFGDHATFETEDRRPAVGWSLAGAFLTGFEAGLDSEKEFEQRKQATLVLANWKTPGKSH